MSKQQPRIAVPRPAERQLREQRCGTCHWCQPLNQQTGLCHGAVPEAQYMPNPNYVSAQLQHRMSGEEKKAVQAQPPALIMFPYPWPTMFLDTDFCPGWKKQTEIQIAKNIPDMRRN